MTGTERSAVRGRDDGLHQVTVVLDGGPGTDEAEVAKLAGQLRRQLLGLDVESVELARTGDVPSGAKPLDPVSVGALVVTLAAGALKAVVAVVDLWLRHRPVRGVRLTIGRDTIEITDASEAAQQRLVEAFVDRHTES
jgi:hypothetical protein